MKDNIGKQYRHYFTFNTNHTDYDGQPLYNSYLEVITETKEKAIEIVIEHFTDKWDSQYNYEEFETILDKYNLVFYDIYVDNKDYDNGYTPKLLLNPYKK